jgi:hypothetical protein
LRKAASTGQHWTITKQTVTRYEINMRGAASARTPRAIEILQRLNWPHLIVEASGIIGRCSRSHQYKKCVAGL